MLTYSQTAVIIALIMGFAYISMLIFAIRERMVRRRTVEEIQELMVRLGPPKKPAARLSSNEPSRKEFLLKDYIERLESDKKKLIQVIRDIQRKIEESIGQVNYIERREEIRIRMAGVNVRNDHAKEKKE